MEIRFRVFVNLIVVVAFVGGILLFVGCAKEEPEEYRIGAILPLTGGAALWGNNVKKGIDLAVEEANSTGGINGRKITVIYEDSKGLAKEGVAAINKLVSIDKVPAILDDCVSSVALAIIPIASKNQVVMISAGSTNPKLSEAGPYFFRVWNSDAEEGLFSARYAYEELGIRKPAILHIENEYGQGLKEVFMEQFRKLGGDAVVIESFKQEAMDFKGQLTKIKGSKPDVIYLVSNAQEIPIILKQARELEIDVPFLGTVAFEDPSIIEKAGNAAEGIIYPFPGGPSGGVVQKFRSAYSKRNGEEPGIASDTGYDCAKLIIHGISEGGYSGPAIQKVLADVKGWEGTSGLITFDENGDVHKPMLMKTVKDGKLVFLN